MKPGIEHFISKASLEMQNESEYYLSIIRVSDNKSLFNEFIINLELPQTGIFGCLDSTKIKIIEQIVKQSIITTFSVNSPGSFVSAEQSGIGTLATIINDLVSGNCCIPSNNVASNWLASEGFEELDIPVQVLGESLSIDSPNSFSQRSYSDWVTDFSGLLMAIDGDTINLKDELNAFIVDEGLDSSNPYFYIIDQGSTCNGDYNFAENQLLDNLPTLGGIIYIQDSNVGEDKLFARLEGIRKEDLPHASASEGSFEPLIGGAANFQELVDIIREAEDSLINHGYEDIPSRIKILRGIYYGTSWSMDFDQSYGTTTRNTGFKVYLCTPSDPINPTQILGTDLFQKLKSSPEVTDGNNGVDWGHVIIGLEARLNWCSREINTVAHSSSGLEITTWIGDIGGGAGMLAYKRIGNPNKRAKDMFNGKSDFGGWINLEGDIAAYLIGRDRNNFDSTPSVSYEAGDYIADLVEDYLLPQPATDDSEWNQRGKLFLKMIGGDITEDGTLANEDELSESVSREVEDFAENYVINMATGRNSDNDPSNDVNMYQASRYLEGASKEITDIFIHTLLKAANEPDEPVKAGGFDPDPTPPGEAYTKYKAWEKTKDLMKKMEDWFKN